VLPLAVIPQSGGKSGGRGGGGACRSILSDGMGRFLRTVKPTVLCVMGLLVLAAVGPAGGQDVIFDRYGGLQESQAAATGWFRAERAQGRCWLVDPDGHWFLSAGVNNVNPRPDVVRGTDRVPYYETVEGKYGSERRWAEAAVGRLRGWGFNTLGAWSAPGTWSQDMPYTVILHFADLTAWGEGESFADVFDPDFESAAIRHARSQCQSLADDPALMGYFTDNELSWGGEEGCSGTLFADFLGRGDSAPGRQALLRFLERRYLNAGELNRVWGTGYESFQQIGRVPQVGSAIPREDVADFLRLAAEQYFRIVHDAIRGVDEHHLILGCRFAGPPPRPVLEAMQDYVDVVSLNDYGASPPLDVVRGIYRIVEKPVLISEFSFRAKDSGLPNTRGAGIVLDTQRARAEHFEEYVQGLIALPMVVGYHWFEHADQPAEGSSDGENSNYGLVSIQDEPYRELTEVTSRANRAVYDRALGGFSQR